jgi:hypothetical protein
MDLERSFEALSSCEHFHASTLRGWIRSLQLRHRAADQLFVAARREGDAAPKSAANLVYRIQLEFFHLDDAMARSRCKESEAVTSGSELDVPEPLHAKHPEIRYALDLRKHMDALIRVCYGDNESALAAWQELIEASAERHAGVLFFYYVGAAAALHNLERFEECDRRLEEAELALQAAPSLYYQVHGAVIIAAFRSFRGHDDAARSWQTFLLSLKCLDATKAVFRRRSRLMLERSFEHGAVVLI